MCTSFNRINKVRLPPWTATNLNQFLTKKIKAATLYNSPLSPPSEALMETPLQVWPFLNDCCHGNSICLILSGDIFLRGFDSLTTCEMSFKLLELMWNDTLTVILSCLLWRLLHAALLRVHQLCSTWSSTTSRPLISTSHSTSTLAREDGRRQLTWWERWEVFNPGGKYCLQRKIIKTKMWDMTDLCGTLWMRFNYKKLLNYDGKTYIFVYEQRYLIDIYLAS